MMLERYIDISLIRPELSATSQEEVIREMARFIAASRKEISAEEVEAALSAREQLDSTGIQEGIAIPHAKMESVKTPFIALGRSTAGINFHSHDDTPTHLFFVMLAPTSGVDEHIKLLSRIAKLLERTSLKERLLSAKGAKEIYDALMEFDRA